MARPGLRLQILLLLGGLLLAAFLPLYFAVATYARFTLQEVRETSARALGRVIAGEVAEAQTRRPGEDLGPLLAANVGDTGVLALALLDREGRVTKQVGEASALGSLGPVDAHREAVRRVVTSHGAAIAVVVPDAEGAVVAVLRTDAEAARVAPVMRFSALYMGLVALSLLVVSYLALTRFIVTPLDELSRAAERVAGGARRLDVPKSGARELEELGDSFRTMTERLLSEEQALRNKIDEVERATASLREAQDRLVRSERLASVGRLAAGLAHEVGNPIAALLGLEDLLLAGGLDETEQRDFVARIRRETERIHVIVRNLLDFARPAAAATGAPVTPGDVEAAVQDTAQLLVPQKSMRDVDLALDVAPGLPLVTLSREQLVQVLLNLLLNAADACGGAGRVRVVAAPSALGVRLQVEDDGPGVSPEVVSRLFEPFVTTKEVGKGTGLGLAVCRGLVESAGGTIALDATRPRGACFVVDLPRARDRSETAERSE
ncbi:MAG TPA: HAMP domain-containing sensor histidine kinase [Polyangiaceae bacterium]|nr:HAMP domain-containing sensor histidine kinase [Polyangiaceae bacterium]